MPRALWWSKGGGAVSYERGTLVRIKMAAVLFISATMKIIVFGANKNYCTNALHLLVWSICEVIFAVQMQAIDTLWR
jgi:hypothetical protein